MMMQHPGTETRYRSLGVVRSQGEPTSERLTCSTVPSVRQAADRQHRLLLPPRAVRAVPAFTAARPELRGRRRSPGHAYRREMYEQIAEGLLAEASLGARGRGRRGGPGRAPDRWAMDRVVRERERAVARYLRDPDAVSSGRWQSWTATGGGEHRRANGDDPGRCCGPLREGAAGDLAEGRGRLRRRLLASALGRAAPSPLGSELTGCRRALTKASSEAELTTPRYAFTSKTWMPVVSITSRTGARHLRPTPTTSSTGTLRRQFCTRVATAHTRTAIASIPEWAVPV